MAWLEEAVNPGRRWCRRYGLDARPPARTAPDRQARLPGIRPRAAASPARENEVHDPGGRIGLGKFHREQVEHRALAGRIDVSALAAFDALEAQRRAAT